MAPFAKTQSNAVIDSLLNELQFDKSDMEKVDIYNLLSKHYFRINPVKSIKFGKEALSLSKQINYLAGESKAYSSIGQAKLLSKDKEVPVNYADSALVIAININDQYLQAIALHVKGLAYHLHGQYDKSLRNYHEALEINKSIGNDGFVLTQLNNIALVRRELKDYASALNYLEEASGFAEKVDKSYLPTLTINKGYVYLDQNKFEEALPYVENVFDDYINSDDSLSITIAYNIMAQVRSGLGDIGLAKNYADNALRIANNLSYTDGIFNAKVTRTKLFYKNRLYKDAIKEGLDAISSADSTLSTRYLDDILNTIAQSYHSIGDLSNAYAYQLKYNKVRDKIYNEDQQHLSMRLDVDYQIAAKEKENENLKRQAEINVQLIQKQKYIYWGTSFIAFLGIVLSYLLYNSLNFRRNYSKTLENSIAERTKELEVKNDRLLTSNKELERFAYIASHDLKEPLLNINSFSKLLTKEAASTDNDKVKNYAAIINTGSDRMYQLVESILEFSSLEEGKVLKFDQVDFNLLMDQVKLNLKTTMNEAHAVLEFNKLPIVYGNAALLFSVLKNLIENAIKFNKSGNPKIEIHSKEEVAEYIISVKDNGIGINEDFKESIFEMFNRLNNRNEFQGSGMGLAICKKIILLHKGKIWVENNPTEGSTFYFTVPKAKM